MEARFKKLSRSKENVSGRCSECSRVTDNSEEIHVPDNAGKVKYWSTGSQVTGEGSAARSNGWRRSGPLFRFTRLDDGRIHRNPYVVGEVEHDLG